MKSRRAGDTGITPNELINSLLVFAIPVGAAGLAFLWLTAQPDAFVQSHRWIRYLPGICFVVFLCVSPLLMNLFWAALSSCARLFRGKAGK